jgi:hypothetical protein
VGSSDGLDAVVKRKIPSSHRESNPRNPIAQPVARDISWVSSVLPYELRDSTMTSLLPNPYLLTIHDHFSTSFGATQPKRSK